MNLQTAPEPILLDFYRRRLRCGLSVVWWRSGQGVGLATPKVAGSTPGLALSGNNLGQVVHPHVPLSLSSTGQRAAMPCGWESNRRSGIAQTSVLRAHALRKADEHPAYTPHGPGTLCPFHMCGRSTAIGHVRPPVDSLFLIQLLNKLVFDLKLEFCKCVGRDCSLLGILSAPDRV